MSIGKLLHLFLIGSFCYGCASTTQIPMQDQSTAWWLSEELFANSTEINGIDISNIDPDWKYATVLSKKYFELRLSKDQIEDIRQSDLHFELIEKLGSAQQEDTFVVGAYETLSGHKGRFIAVFRGTTFIQKFTHSGFSGYSSLYLDGNHLRWYKCIQCSDFDELRWSELGYSLQ